MVNNSTNFNKRNYHLLPLTSKCKKDHDIENPVPDLGQTQKCGGVNPVNGIPTLFLWLLDLVCFISYFVSWVVNQDLNISLSRNLAKCYIIILTLLFQASGSSQGVNGSGESLGAQTSQLGIKGPSSSLLQSSGRKVRSKGSLSQQHYDVPHGTEVW